MVLSFFLQDTTPILTDGHVLAIAGSVLVALITTMGGLLVVFLRWLSPHLERMHQSREHSFRAVSDSISRQTVQVQSLNEAVAGLQFSVKTVSDRVTAATVTIEHLQAMHRNDTQALVSVVSQLDRMMSLAQIILRDSQDKPCSDCPAVQSMSQQPTVVGYGSVSRSSANMGPSGSSRSLHDLRSSDSGGAGDGDVSLSPHGCDG